MHLPAFGPPTPGGQALFSGFIFPSKWCLPSESPCRTTEGRSCRALGPAHLQNSFREFRINFLKFPRHHGKLSSLELITNYGQVIQSAGGGFLRRSLLLGFVLLVLIWTTSACDFFVSHLQVVITENGHGAFNIFELGVDLTVTDSREQVIIQNHLTSAYDASLLRWDLQLGRYRVKAEAPGVTPVMMEFNTNGLHFVNVNFPEVVVKGYVTYHGSIPPDAWRDQIVVDVYEFDTIDGDNPRLFRRLSLDDRGAFFIAMPPGRLFNLQVWVVLDDIEHSVCSSIKYYSIPFTETGLNYTF